MSVQVNEPVALSRRSTAKRWPRSFSLAWLIALAVTIPLPVLLPVPGAPVFLAGFLGAVGALALLARPWLIALLPPLAVLGPYFLPLEAAGVNVFGFRLVIMLLAVFSTPLTNRGTWWFNPVARRSAMFMLLWVVWAILSLFWAPHTGAGLNEIVTLIFGLGLLLVLLSLHTHQPAHLHKLRFGWLIGLLAAAGSAVVEIVTGYGLPGDLTEEIVVSDVTLDPAGLDPAISSTLGYSNQFGGFLLLTVPFVLWSVERATGPAKLFHLALLTLIGVLILYSASRLSLIGFVVQLLAYALLVHRRWYMPLVVLVGALAGLVVYSTVIVDSNLRIAEKLVQLEGGGDRSTTSRLALTLNGLWMVYQTGGRGVGAGGYESEIGGDVPFEIPIRTRTDWNPHNLWIEVLSEYGVLVFAAYMGLLGWIGLLGWRALRSRAGGDAAAVGGAVLVGLIGYLFCGVASGSIMSKPTHWMFLSSLVIMAAFLQERRTAARRARTTD